MLGGIPFQCPYHPRESTSCSLGKLTFGSSIIQEANILQDIRRCSEDTLISSDIMKISKNQLNKPLNKFNAKIMNNVSLTIILCLVSLKTFMCMFGVVFYL